MEAYVKWFVVKKPVGYKILYAANPPKAEGEVVAAEETYAEAAAVIEALRNFDAGAPAKGNA